MRMIDLRMRYQPNRRRERRERPPVVGLGKPGGDAGQPRQRPARRWWSGRGSVRVVWPGRGEFGHEIVNPGI